MKLFIVIIAILFLASFRPGECGRGTIADLNDETFELLIAGGYHPDNVHLSRHVVSIRTRSEIEYPGDNHFCAGIVMNSRMVLTAAHCVTDIHKAILNPRGLLVVVGSPNRLAEISSSDWVTVDRVVVHPKYKRYVYNDLALLRLSYRTPRNMRQVKPVKRHRRSNVTEGAHCVTMGWGQLYKHGPYSNNIIYMDVILRPHEHCREHIKNSYHAEGNLCAEPDVEGEVCPGDLGGPLFCNDMLVGMLAGAQECQGIRAIKFVNICHYEDWVDETIDSVSDNGSVGTISGIFVWQLIEIVFIFIG